MVGRALDRFVDGLRASDFSVGRGGVDCLWSVVLGGGAGCPVG